MNGSIVTSDVPDLARRALAEVAGVFMSSTSDAAARMGDEILDARRIACYGVGREGLMMRALCMRLMHLGLDAHIVGDMTTPPVGEGDLLLVSAGPGAFSTVMGLLGVAKSAGVADSRYHRATPGRGGTGGGRGGSSSRADDGRRYRGRSRIAADGKSLRSGANDLLRPHLDSATGPDRANAGADAGTPHKPGMSITPTTATRASRR